MTLKDTRRPDIPLRSQPAGLKQKNRKRETERIQVVNTPIHVSLDIHSLGYDNTVLTMLIRGAYIY